MNKLGEHQKEGYLKDPTECPHCYSDNIMAVDYFDHETNSVKVQCQDCLQTWYDCYTLTDIEEA